MATSEDNTLEQALRRAAAEPAERPAFYRLLLESTVYVIGTSDLPLGEGAALQPGARVQVQHWKKEDGSLVIPFFSSLRTLHQAVENEERHMALPGHILFEVTRGSTPTPCWASPGSIRLRWSNPWASCWPGMAMSAPPT